MSSVVRRASHVHQIPHARLAPEHSGHEAEARVEDGDLGRGYGESVGAERLEGIAMSPIKVGQRCRYVDVGEDEREDGVREVIVEDALQIAHGLFHGGEEDGLAEADDQDRNGSCEPEPGEIAESGGTRHDGIILSRIRGDGRGFGISRALSRWRCCGGGNESVSFTQSAVIIRHRLFVSGGNGIGLSSTGFGGRAGST